MVTANGDEEVTYKYIYKPINRLTNLRNKIRPLGGGSLDFEMTLL